MFHVLNVKQRLDNSFLLWHKRGSFFQLKAALSSSLTKAHLEVSHNDSLNFLCQNFIFQTCLEVRKFGYVKVRKFETLKL